MTIIPSLCNLPDVVAINIFNRVGFESIQNLRKVCRDLRNRIDDIKPEANLLRVLIDVLKNDIRFFYESEIQTLDGFVDYDKTMESGRSIVRCRGSAAKSVNGDFVELASRDLLLILKFQKKSIKLISFENSTGSSNNFLQFLENLKRFLRLENRLLKVHNVHIQTNDPKSVITALSLIDPQSIYSIDIHNWNEGILPLDIAEITEMEQWKNAKYFYSHSIITGVSAHNFRHFARIDVKFQSISAEYLLDLKKIFQNSTEADLFIIQYKTFEGREQFLEKMGPLQTVEDRFWWFFRMSTTDDYVLCIQLIDRFKSITFGRCCVNDVTENDVIQNE